MSASVLTRAGVARIPFAATHALVGLHKLKGQRTVRQLARPARAWLAAAAVILLSFTVYAGLSKDFASAQGQPWIGALGARGVRATTAELMARQRTRDAHNNPSAHPPRPLHRADRRTIPQHRQSPASAQRMDMRAQLAPRAAQQVGVTFTGETLPSPTSGPFPPDSMGAAGPTQFLVAVNSRFRVFDKQGNPGALDISPDLFFQSVLSPDIGIPTFTTDPRVRYDRATQRWFIVMIDVSLATLNSDPVNNRVMIAVSDGPTITGATVWTFFYFQQNLVAPAGDNNCFADYPSLGIDIHALYIGADMFCANGDYQTTGFVVRKSSILDTGPIIVTAFRNLGSALLAGPTTPQGVDNFDSNATEGYFIGADTTVKGVLRLVRISDPGGSPSLRDNIPIVVPATQTTIKIPHKGNTGGSNGQLDGIDDRLMNAVIRNGQLWTVHSIGVTSSGSAPATVGGVTRNALRWYQLGNLASVPTVLQAGTLFDSATSAPQFYTMPSIMVSGQGHVALGGTVAGANAFADAFAVGRLASDAPNTLDQVVKYTSSTSAYNPPGDPGSASFGRRWGDYSFTSLDPCDDMSMWTVQEWTKSTNSYGVQVARLLAPPPAAPLAINPPTVAQGQSAATLTVMGLQSFGSGFYDPGSDFACRLQASLGSDVVITNSVYNSPTSLTLTVSTQGANPGAHDLTITNPDGQSVSGTGLLTVIAAPETPTATLTATPEPTVTPTSTPEQNNRIELPVVIKEAE